MSKEKQNLINWIADKMKDYHDTNLYEAMSLVELKQVVSDILQYNDF